jgi:hypothetical protein
MDWALAAQPAEFQKCAVCANTEGLAAVVGAGDSALQMNRR